jgi:hypothetical protein
MIRASLHALSDFSSLRERNVKVDSYSNGNASLTWLTNHLRALALDFLHLINRAAERLTTNISRVGTITMAEVNNHDTS